MYICVMAELQVSYRAFAKMVGMTEGAVRKAVERGTIKEGVTGTDTASPKIIPSKASMEWGKVIMEPDDDDDQDPDVTDADRKAAETVDMSKGIADNTTKAEADRMAAIYKARKLRSEALEMEGLLVEKGLVYKVLFELGAAWRDVMLNVPARCIDNVIAAYQEGGRNAAEIAMADEQSAAISSFINTNNVEFLKN